MDEFEITDEVVSKTLFINMSSSVCGNCNKESLPECREHSAISGYGKKGRVGCGVKWEYVSSHYVRSGLEKILREIRPDLTYYEYRPKVK